MRIQMLLKELAHDQERAVVADKRLLLCAICVLSQWTLEQIRSSYRLTEAECIKSFAQLDRIGIIELRPLNRYRLKLAKTFRWRPHGPVMNYFRDNALLDYFSGGFDASGEGLLLAGNSPPSPGCDASACAADHSRLLGPVSSTREGMGSSLSRKPSSRPAWMVSGPWARVAPSSRTSGLSRCSCAANSLRTRLRVRIQ